MELVQEEVRKPGPDRIMLDMKTRQMVLDYNMQILDLQKRIQQILQVYLNATRSEGSYSLSNDFSVLVKDKEG